MERISHCLASKIMIERRHGVSISTQGLSAKCAADLAWKTITVGVANAAHVHPREVFQTAVAIGAGAIICAHNHPSGDTTPSREDIDVTERLVKAGELLGIRVLDHIVFSDLDFVSLMETGRM